MSTTNTAKPQSVRSTIAKSKDPKQIMMLVEKSKSFDASPRSKRRIAEAAEKRLAFLSQREAK